MKNTIGLLTLLLAYVLLYPGLTEPVLSITGSVDRQDIAVIGKDIIVSDPDTPELVATLATVLVDRMKISGSVEAYQKTRSILGTVNELFNGNHRMVAFLIALFSIVIPVIKGLMLIATYLPISSSFGPGLQRVSSLLSKWSMADVFVIGIFVSFLAANAVEKEGGLLTFDAQLGTGFYFFLGYCILSILASQILVDKVSSENEARSA